ncbi:MAG: hypothetical protein GOMPHAMPRED_003633 [Gomphillus americanus]|uniref:Biogenesis of lysosome-related organelles complex 1 subunit 1 n=1 Tax=Gomphillus americanus TaxID=1940652 RepID=A0A8H3IMG7_9LECA|nr:MAG: hypothetical protein GOMPHAMPRED_003633 [Gomphillus americanus]
MADIPTPASAGTAATTTNISSPVLSTATSSTAVESGNAAAIGKDESTPPKETPTSVKPFDRPLLTPQSTTSTATAVSSTTPAEIDSAKRTDEARTAFIASLQAIGSSADAGLQARAADITANHAVLNKQQEGLDEAAAALAKETGKYQKLADETRDKMKDVGDVQNFAEVIERELMVLEETLRIIEEEGEDEEEREEREGKGKKGQRKKWWF